MTKQGVVRDSNEPLKFAEDESIVKAFEQQVKIHADKPAIRTRQNQSTYGELNDFANRLAWRLLEERGEGKEAVGVYLSEPIQTIAAILGTLKAGKYYVALDPQYPRERIEYILDNCEAKAILTDEPHAAAVTEFERGDFPVVNVDTLPENGGQENPKVPINTDDIASILFTSGSTGTPKGILRTHRQRLRHAKGTPEDAIRADDRVLLVNSILSASSSATIFKTLLNGASLHLYAIRKAGFANLANWLREEEITIYTSVPSLFRSFAATLQEGEEFPHLRLIRLGAETILKHDVELYKKHFAKHSQMRIGYSSSEAGNITERYLDGETVIEGDIVPVGYAVRNRQIELWDEAGVQVPKGEVGEIVARGKDIRPKYWKLPEQADKVYIPDPKEEGWMYCRTGDMGRFLPDGQLVLVGRKDDMVKIRGFRVETAEIESALHQNAAVEEAAVVGRELKNGAKQLVAYVVLRSGANANASELRRGLGKRLLDYMIPATFMFLDELPLTAAGKVNRRALPVPIFSRDSLGVRFVSPRGEVEIRLVKAWEQTLEFSPIGTHDNFFDLGGDSLTAARLFANIEKEFDRKLPLALLYEASNVSQQAALMRRKGWRPEWTTMVTIQSKGSRPPLFCMAARGGNVLSYRQLSERLGLDQPVYALQSRGLSGKQIPETRMEAIAAQYLQEVKKIQPEGPYLLCGSSFGGGVAYEIGQQLWAEGERDVLVMMFDTFGPDYKLRASGTSRITHWLFQRYRQVEQHVSNLWVADRKERRSYLGLRWQIVKKRLRKVNPLARRKYYREPNRLAPELRRVEAANRRASRRYQVKPYAGKVILFRAEKQPLGIQPDPTMGWGRFVQNLETIGVPGHHGNLLFEPRVDVVAAEVARVLARARGEKDLSTPAGARNETKTSQKEKHSIEVN